MANRKHSWTIQGWGVVLALMMVTPLLWAVDPDELLPPEQAFALSVESSSDTVIATWIIADGYYLYRERLTFEALTSAITLGEPVLPDGKIKNDEFFGDMEVYRHQVRATIPLTRTTNAPAQLELKIGSQGCADVGVCYPPQTDVVTIATTTGGSGVVLANPATMTGASNPVDNLLTLTLPVTDPVGSSVNPPNPPLIVAQSDSVAGGFVSEQDRLSQRLIEQRFWALPLFFGLGLLLAFTPCVFPMVPILSSIIVGQGENLTRGRALRLSLVYVLAMALTYTVVGVVAASFGQNIQIWFQNPWVLISFSTLFVLLALSMFGFYDLQLPVRWQTRLTEFSHRQRGGRYLGVGIMGVLSALIVGPCVAAPLIGVLSVISVTGDTVLGGTALFAMSLGMGVPLLIIGVSAGKLLPKAGPWMNTIKAVFGVLMLALAIWMLERILPETLSLLLWALLLIVTATYMGAFRSASTEAAGSRLLVKGLGVVVMAYGILLLVGVAAGGSDPWRPLQGTGLLAGGTAQAPLVFKPIKTVADLEREVEWAQAQGRPVMLDFYADWCVSCKEMERDTFSDLGVQAALRDALLLQADVTLNDTADQALLAKYNLIGPPAILFFDRDGIERPAYRVVGFMSAETFQKRLALVITPASVSVASTRRSP